MTNYTEVNWQDGAAPYTNVGLPLMNAGIARLNPVANIAALTSLSGYPDGSVVRVSGYTTAGDGGGGDFRKTSSTATVNNGTVFSASGGGRWERIVEGPIQARWFGARFDGTTNDITAIQAAHDYIVATGKAGALMLSPSATTKINSTLTINITYVSLIGYGTKIDASAITTGRALNVIGTMNPPYNQATQKVAGIEVVGNGAAGTVRGIDLTSSGTGMGTSHISLENVVIHEFGTGLYWGDNAYTNNCYNLDIYNCGICMHTAAGTADAPERVTVLGGTFFNSNKMLLCENPNGDVMLNGVSLDYCTSGGRLIEVSAGSCYANNCHFESNHVGDWFYVTGSNSALKISQSQLVNQNQTTSIPIGYSDASVRRGGIEIVESWFSHLNNAQPVIIDGSGRAVVRNLGMFEFGAPKIPSSQYMNVFRRGAFSDSTALDEWSLPAGAQSPVVATDQFLSSPSSLKFLPSVNGNTVAVQSDFAIPRGAAWGMSYRIRTSGLAAAGKAFNFRWVDLGQNDVVLFGPFTLISYTTDLGSWTLQVIAPGSSPSPSTQKIRLILELPAGTTSTTVWLDDLIVTPL